MREQGSWRASGPEETQSGWRTVRKKERSETRAGKAAAGGPHGAFAVQVRRLEFLSLTR